jgi:hypothetical protein
MKLFFNKADRIRLLGFDDMCFAVLGLFPLAGLGHLLFGGADFNLPLADNLICFGIAMGFTGAYWLASRFIVLQFRERFSGEDDTLWRIALMQPVLFGAVVIISQTGSFALSLVETRVLIPEPSIFFKVIMSYTLVVMVLAIYEGVFFFTKYRQSSLERERLAKENMQSQLSVLKQQMNPHFLFNSLNTLVNIIPEDGRKAALFTQRLSAVYRRILDWRHKELITLEEEMAAVQDYVFLMQTRFEDKLRVCWRCRAGTRVQCEGEGQTVRLPAEYRGYRIVPLSIQLLVENAIKHNVVSEEHPLRIDIWLTDNRIAVSNPLNLRGGRSLDSTGWGHQNLKARYEMVTEAPVEISQTADTYEVSIPIFPAKSAVRYATA